MFITAARSSAGRMPLWKWRAGMTSSRERYGRSSSGKSIHRSASARDRAGWRRRFPLLRARQRPLMQIGLLVLGRCHSDCRGQGRNLEQRLLHERMGGQPLLFARVELGMAAITAAGDVLDDFQTAGLGFRASKSRYAGGKSLSLGGALQPDLAVPLFMTFGKIVEAFKTLAKRRFDRALFFQLRQTDGEGHVHLEAGNATLATGHLSGCRYIGIHTGGSICFAASYPWTIGEHRFEKALSRVASHQIMHVIGQGPGGCLRPQK